MNVTALQKFLRSLAGPLADVGGHPSAAADLERACLGLEPFGARPVGEFAEFLTRAHAYERDGHWPSTRPAINGSLVDEPGMKDYAERLKAFLVREAAGGGALPDHVCREVKKLEGMLKLPQVQELARELGVEGAVTKKDVGMRMIVAKVTGQPLPGKPARASAKAKAAPGPEPAALAERLRGLAGTPELAAELQSLAGRSLPDIKAVAAALGVTGVRAKAQGVDKIRERLSEMASVPAAAEAGAGAQAAPPPTAARVTRFVEVIGELKAKAEMPAAPNDEIEAELRSLGEQMSKEEAVEVAERIGVVRRVTTRAEALEAIQRKVFEVRRARESIAY